MPTDVKITDLPSASEVNDTDLFVVVDVTSTPTTKKVTAALVAAAAPVQSVAGQQGDVTLAVADISGLQTELDGKQSSGSYVVTTDSRLTDARDPLAHTHTASAISDFSSAVAAASPEEVLEYTTVASFPATGNSSLLYIATDAGRAYRWVGSQYAEIGPTSISVTGSSYTLPVATGSVLGGVKAGSNVTIAGDGTISVAAPVTTLAYTAITGTPNLGTAAAAAAVDFAAASHTHALSSLSQSGASTGQIPQWDGTAWAAATPAPATDSLLRGLFAPPAPTSLAVSSGNAQVTLSWSAPTVTAQAPITDYVVQFSSDSGSTWSTFADGTSTATSATVTGLTNGTAYVFRVAAVNSAGTGAYSSTASGTPVGLITAQYLIAAGGGGGGGFSNSPQFGGGGGGGGLLSGSESLSSGQTYTVTVGGGGAGGGTTAARGTTGSNSVFSSLTANGGGGGGIGGGALSSGLSGGCGGGGGSIYAGPPTRFIGAAGTGTAGQGNDGGRGHHDNNYETVAAGGGGGAGAAGADGTRFGSGKGGDGALSSITGTATRYSGGGAAMGDIGNGGAGLGGGGNRDTAGSANTGGGGGAASGGAGVGLGAAGGSGVVIIRLPVAAASTIGSPTVTTSGGDTIYTFTGTGSITI